MTRHKTPVLWFLVLAGACATASAATAQTDQPTVLGELPLTYVSAEAARQVPCPVAASAPTDPQRFPNSLLIGSWMLRTERGTTICRFHQTDAGFCTFGNPGHLVVEKDDVTTIYDITNSSGAEVEIRDGRHACRIGRRIRTHGDTIVPNR